jgi:acyl carrier protein
METVGVGVRGELYIGGVAVGRGYMGRAEQTAERFVPDPYGRESGGRLYRTGDEVRYLGGGEIEYLGRRDTQVKVRGLRIELGEIEWALEQHEGIREAVVVVREEVEGDQRLVAYIVAESDTQVRVDEIRGYLRRRIPEYMMPQAYVEMARMPVTGNGKVDRGRLPEVGRERPELEEEYVGPRSEMEEVVAGVWREVLGVERVGMRDNFFDVGGHSLLMVEVKERLGKEVGREVKLIELFQYPTIDSLVEHLNRNKDESPSLTQSHIRAETRRELRKRRSR